MQILEYIIFLSFEDLERRKIAIFLIYPSLLLLLLLSHYFLLSEIFKFLQNGPHQSLSQHYPNKSLPLSNSTPSATLPPPPPLICTSAPTVKSVPSAPPPQIVVGPPLLKKLAYLGPFIKGQLGTIFFSLDRPHNYMEIPHGFSLIVNSFHTRHRHELVDSKYVIVDPLRNSWSSPEVFVKWWSCIENKEIEDLDLSKVQLAIVHYGNTFKLCTSDKKSKYQTQTHFIPTLELAEEDPCEKKDPDYFLSKDEDDDLN